MVVGESLGERASESEDPGVGCARQQRRTLKSEIVRDWHVIALVYWL